MKNTDGQYENGQSHFFAHCGNVEVGQNIARASLVNHLTLAFLKLKMIYFTSCCLYILSLYFSDTASLLVCCLFSFSMQLYKQGHKGSMIPEWVVWLIVLLKLAGYWQVLHFAGDRLITMYLAKKERSFYLHTLSLKLMGRENNNQINLKPTTFIFVAIY